MRCPGCNIDVMEMELAGVKIDYCIKCEGIWISKEKLTELLDEGKLKKFFDTLTTSGEKEDLKCPTCNKEMKIKTFSKTSDTSDIKIMDCPNNHGIWLSKNDLIKLLSSTNLDKEKQVLPLLKDMFV
ncbi:MAG: zf-TFIIB domain-containing protein [Bacillota bacterium]